MKKQQTIRRNTIHFKRWSRKAYAIFAGLKKEISIGRVGKSISEKSLTKNKSLQKLNLHIVNLLTRSIANELLDKNSDFEKLEQAATLLAVENTPMTTAAHINIKHTLLFYTSD